MPLPDPHTRRLRLASALQGFRERAMLSAAGAARRMGEGAAFANEIYAWEAGESTPSADELWRFLDAAGATFAELEVELEPEKSNPRVREIAAELEALAER